MNLNAQEDKVVALAAATQAVALVHNLAQNNVIETSLQQTLIHSIFVTEPKNVIQIYGNINHLHLGLNTLRDILEKNTNVIKKPYVRYLFILIRLEKYLKKDKTRLSKLGSRIEETKKKTDTL